MKCYVYVIKSIVRNYIYVGLTLDVNNRIFEHNSGKNKTTKPYRPFKIIFVEEYPTRDEARKREKYLKGGTGKEWIKENYINITP